MTAFTRFIIQLFVFSLVVAGCFYAAEPYFSGKAAFAAHIYIQLVMMATTIILHLGLTGAAQKGGASFIRFFMGATSAKLLLFMMIMVLYGITNKPTAFGFILHFFIYYLLYTVFDVAVAYKKFGQRTPQD